jgi:hypothetical protein
VSSRGILAVIALAGCDRVFGLHRDVDAGPPGEPGPDSSIVVPACTSGEKLAMPLLADTYLDGVAPRGRQSILRVSAVPSILLTFATGDNAFVHVDLRLQPRALARACGGPLSQTCVQCPRGPGDLRVYWVRTDWHEDVANRMFRDTAAPWETPGAMGATDRSAVVGSPTYVGGTLTASIDFASNELQASWPTGQLGVMIAADGLSAPDLAFASRETASDDCETSPAVPELVVTCQ